jgi:hypothetical protein
VEGIIIQAERASEFDGYRRYVVLTGRTYQDEGVDGNTNRIPAVRLAVRDGDDVQHATEGAEWDGNPTGRRIAGTR